MRHEYYGYSKEELLANRRFPLYVWRIMSRYFVIWQGEMAETIEAHNAEGKNNGIYLALSARLASIHFSLKW